MRRISVFLYHPRNFSDVIGRAAFYLQRPGNKDSIMLKMVVIDDNAISRNLLGTILVDGGHEVIGNANTSSAGLARMIRLQPQIAFVDIGAADENGVALIESLHEALPKTLLFLVSGKIDENMVQFAVRHGIHGVIVKPFNSVTVLATIRNAVIRFARRQRQAAASP
jgi:two-component system chemotaxis response regulator CheY